MSLFQHFEEPRFKNLIDLLNVMQTQKSWDVFYVTHTLKNGSITVIHLVAFLTFSDTHIGAKLAEMASAAAPTVIGQLRTVFM